jgi:hypothetical protein
MPRIVCSDASSLARIAHRPVADFPRNRAVRRIAPRTIRGSATQYLRMISEGRHGGKALAPGEL